MLKIQVLRGFLARMSKREKIVLYVTVSVVSLTLVDRLIVHPIFARMRLLDKSIKEKEATIRKNTQILTHKEQIAAQLAEYSSFFVGSQSAEEEMTDLLKEIERLANKSSVYLIDLKPAGIKKEESIDRYTVNLACEAQMEQITEFLYGIESSEQLLTIDKFQINPKSRDSSVISCTMAVSKKNIQ